MWTQENRHRYDRSKLRYPSDLTDEEWSQVAPLIPPAKRGGAKLYQETADTEPRVREAACWAHLRRDFNDIWKATASPLAKDALERIGRLYDIEREITGQPAERRREARQNRSRPHVDAFRLWCEAQLARVPAKGDLAKAMRYALKRWDAFTLFLEDGRIAIDNNPAERAIRPVAIGRKNWLFGACCGISG